MMKILLISISAPPKNSPESFQTGRYLVELAKYYRVSLLTTKPQKGWAPKEEELFKYLNGVDKTYEIRNTPRWLQIIADRFLSIIKVPDEHFFFHWQANFLFFLTKPDVIISRSTPFSSAVMALKLKRKWKVPWIMHLSDPWIDNPFYARSGSQNARDRKLESDCFVTADAISVTSEKTLIFYRTKYPVLAKKIFVQPNVIDSKSITTKTTIDFSKKFTIAFTGRLYGARTLSFIVRTIEALVNANPSFEREIEFVFAGFFDENNISLIKSLNYSNVHFLGHVPHAEALRLQQNAHMLLLIDSLEDDPRYDVFFPSKLLEYFAAQKRIIAITRPTSTVSSLIDHKTGSCFSEADQSALIAYLEQCVQRFKEKDSSFFVVPARATDYLAENKVNLLIEKIRSLTHENNP